MKNGVEVGNVILDRDGVINEDSDAYIKSPDEFILIKGAVNAIFDLKLHDIKIFVATNQSGINREFYNLNTFLNINSKLINTLKNHPLYERYEGRENNEIISGIYYCPHTPEQNCLCRKPLPGMINKIQLNHNINLAKTAFIGDSMRDLEAGHSAGCAYQYLVKTGKGLATLNKYKDRLDPKNIFDDLHSCVTYILKNNI